MSDFEGIHKQVIRAAMSAPYLQREEEHDLALRWSEYARRGSPASACFLAYKARDRDCQPFSPVTACRSPI